MNGELQWFLGNTNDRCFNILDYQKYLWEKDKNLIMHVFVIRYAFIQFCAFLALLPSLNRKKNLLCICFV